MPENSKKIDIEYKKTCDCQDNHINCLDAKEWVKNRYHKLILGSLRNFVCS